jgi:hypothetical protein
MTTGIDGIDPAVAGGRLRTALEAVADTLGRADMDGLLAAEQALESALADCARLAAAGGPAPAALRPEIDAARRALMRCRRLGASLGDFARASFEARGLAIGYDPARTAAATMTGRGFQTRG